mmetsp:Transcript_11305/g.26570  ORF Transcript_11305/g.26570 Transcript_11305/m.26570 type:complete len:299 (+) Transcript_11305:49-945(+)
MNPTRLLALAASPYVAAALLGKRVVVTGANKGIGKAIVRKILSDHPSVSVYLGSRDTARGEAACSDLRSELGDACCEGRLEMLPIDVTNDASVKAAAEIVTSSGEPLYGLINNAGIGFGRTIDETLETNLYGARRVSEALVPLLLPDEGRVVNIASASGPMFVAGLGSPEQAFWADPALLPSWGELEEHLARYKGAPDYDGVAYGLSKAALNVYTQQLAAQFPALRVNSCSPGYIKTDLTAGMGATAPPEKGALAPLQLLLGDLPPPSQGGTARYYGSDAVRSPLDRYRGPGDPPYSP